MDRINVMEEPNFVKIVYTKSVRSILLGSLIIFAGCMSTPEPTATIRYVAIGDSYTVGEGVSQAQAWPAVLTQQLNKAGIQIELVANPGKTGWTTQQAIDYELPVLEQNDADFVTILLGVNDYVQGVPIDIFEQRFSIVVDAAVEQVGTERVVVVTIPDFSVTPTGQTFGNPAELAQGVTEFNNSIKKIAVNRSLTVIDIFPLSQVMREDVTLVAPDGLHPSATMYQQWVDYMYPTIASRLQETSK